MQPRNDDSLETLEDPTYANPYGQLQRIPLTRRQKLVAFIKPYTPVLVGCLAALTMMILLVAFLNVRANRHASSVLQGQGITITQAAANDSVASQLLAINSRLKVLGSAEFRSNLTVAGASNLQTLTVGSNAQVSGDLKVGGQSVLNGGVNVFGNGQFSGTVTAGSFSGNGAGITGVNAQNISQGTLSDNLLSTNVALLSNPNNFLAQNTFADAVSLQRSLSGQSAVFASDVSALTFTQNGNIVCDTSGNCAVPSMTLNGLNGTVALLGTAQQVGVNVSGNNITLSLPQNIDASAVPTFAGAALNGSLTLANGGTVFDSALNGLTFTFGGRTYTLPNSGATNQTICTTGVTCASGGGTALLLAPGTAQVNNQNTPAIFVNNTAGNNVLELQGNGADKFVVSSNGVVSAAGTVTASGFSGDGAGLTNVNAVALNGQSGSYYTNATNLSSGTVADGRLSTNVTTQGNTFNAGSQLVQLLASGLLPSLDGTNVSSVNAASLQGFAASYFTNASNLSSGTVADARLSTNVALLGSSNNFTGTTNSFSGLLATAITQNGNAVCDTSGNCAGAGGGVTTTGGTNGTVALFTGSGTIANSIITQASTTITVAGTLVATALQGDGSGISNVNASNITSGTLSVARGGTGAASFVSNGVLYGNGSGTVQATAAGTTGTCLVGNTGAAPSFQSCTAASGGATPGGPAGGDLSGSYPNPTVSGLNGTALSISGLSGGNFLVYNGTNWVNTSISGDLTASSTGVVTIGNGKVTNLNLVNSSLSVSAGTGLTGGGSVALGGSTSLSVTYGAGAGTAVQGNTTLTCTAGSGNLSGGGTVITLGTGGSCGSLNTVASPSFTSISLGTALSIANGGTGATSASAARSNLGAAASGANSDITSLSGLTTALSAGQGGTGVNGAAAGNGTLLIGNGSGYTLANLAQGSGIAITNGSGSISIAVDNTVCTTAGNCAGVGGGVTTSGGTVGTIALFTGTQAIGNSILTQSGSVLSVAGTLSATALQGDGSAITNLDATKLTSGTVAGARLSGSYTGITGVGALTAGSIGGGFGIISTGSAISTSAALQGNTLAIGGGTFAVNASGAVTAATGLTSSGTIILSSLNTAGVVHTNASGQLSTGAVALGSETSGNYVATLGTLTGLTAGGTTGVGAVPTLSVTYGAAANTAAQGNTALSFSGSGNLTGMVSGTAGGGLTTNTLAIVNNPSFSGLVTANGGLSVGGTSALSVGSGTVTFASLGAGLVQSSAGGVLSSGILDRNSATYFSNQLSVANGGTGATSAGAARTNLGAAASGANSDITSLSGLTTALSAGQGGTGVNGAAAGNGKILIGNGSGYSLANLTQGSGISITNGSGSISIGVDTTICTTAGNCANSGGGVTTTGGTAGTIALFNGSQTIANSIITQASTTVTVAGTLAATALQGDGSLITNINASNIATGTLPTGRISGTYSGLTGTGALTTGSIGSGFGTIATANTISTSAALQGNTLSIGSGAFAVNASGAITAATGLTTSGSVTLSSLNTAGVVHTNASGVLSTGAVTLGSETTGNYVANLGTLTGLTAGGTTGAGAVPTLSVTYGAAASTAAQGNTALSFTGTGNLTGTVSGTAGGGLTTNTLAIVNNPSFSGLLSANGGITVAGTSSINATGTAATTIGNSGAALSVAGNGAATTTNVLAVRVSGDANDRFIVQANGALNFGNGTAATDTTLSRSAANTLSTSGGLTVNGNLLTNGNTTLTVGYTVAQTAAAADINTWTAGRTGVRISGVSSQTADLLQFRASTTALSGFNATGNLYYQSGSFTSTLAQGTLSQNQTITIPASTASTDTFCLVALQNCSGGASGAVTTVGTLDGGTANANGASITTNTIFLQSASASFAGLVNTGAQTLAGAKTFSGLITANANLVVQASSASAAAVSIKDNTGATALDIRVGRASDGNTFIGSSSGQSSVAGTSYGNIALGTNSLYTLTTGAANTALGNTTLGNTTSGYGNTAVGNAALNTNVTGNYNTALGLGAGSKVLGNSNTTIGYQAGLNATGSGNVFLGYNAGSQQTTGDNKLYIANSNTSTPLIGGDFSAATLALNGSVTTSGSQTIQGSAGLLLGVGGTTAGKMTLYSATNANAVTIQTAAQANAVALTIPADTNATDTICLQTLANCASNGANTSSTGTTNYVARFTGTNTLGTGLLYDTGSYAGANITSQLNNSTFGIQGSTGQVALTVQGAASQNIAEFRSSAGTTVVSIGSTGTITTGGDITANGASGSTISAAKFSSTATSGNNHSGSFFASSTALNTTATVTATDAYRVKLTGVNNANANANVLNGVYFDGVTAKTNNAFNGLNFADTSYNSILNVAGTNIISGSGLIQNAALDSTINYSNLQNVTNLTASGAINSVSGYSFNGTAGSTTTCTSGNVLQNAVVKGGIITGGTCVTNGLNTTLQNAYDASGSTNPQIQLSSANGGFKLRDASSTVGNIFQIQNSTGASTYFAVTNSGASVAGTFSATSLVGDGSAITNLNASNLASGTVASSLLSGSYTGITGTGALSSGSIASGFGTITTANAIQGASLTATGALTSGTVSAAGSLVLANGNGTNSTINPGATSTANFSLPAAGGTLCTVTTCASGTGGNGYIQNGTSVQTSASFNIDGNGTIGGSLNVGGVSSSSTINAVSGFKFNGTSGSTTTCTGGNVLQNATVQGGIITGGTCVANGGGYAPTLQNVYDNSASTDPQVQLSSANGGFKLRDASTTVGNIFQIQNATGASTYFAVTASGASVAGTFSATNLAGNGALVTNLDAGNLASGTVASARIAGTYSTLTGTGALNSGSIVAGFGAITTTNAVQAATLTSTGTTTVGSGLTVSAGGASIAGNSAITGNSGVALTVTGAASQNIAEFKNSSSVTKVSIDQNGTLTTPTLVVTSTPANNGGGVGITATATSASGSNTISGTTVGLVGVNTTGSNVLNGINFKTVTAKTNNSFNGLYFADTSYNSILNVAGASIIDGTGTVQSAGITGSYTNLTGTGALTSGSIASGFGSITTNNSIQGSNVTATGALTSGTASAAGSLVLANGNGTSTSLVPAATSAQSFSLPAVGGTLCTVSTCASGSGSTAYIQNGTGVQTSASFNIDGNGSVGGSFNASGALTSAATINAASGFKFNGTAGVSTTCSGGNVLQNATIQGGIVTAGTCVANGGGVAPTLQNVYDNATSPASILLTDAKDFVLTAADTATDSNILFNLQCVTSCGGNGRFAVQNAGTDVFAVNPNGTIVVGNATNGISLSSNGYVLTGTARNAKGMRLSAEYPGAVLDAGTLSNNSGTMTSGIDLTNRMNYYKWTTTQGTNQSYDIDVQVPIPKEFSGWTSNPITFTGYTSNTTSGTISMEARDSSNNVVCNFVNVTPSSTGTWTPNNTACTLSSGTYTPGDYMTLRIRLQSPTGGDVRAGTITMSYLAKY